MRAEFVREYMGDVTSADIVADLKDYCVAQGTTFQSALRDITNRISAARATYTSAPSHEREITTPPSSTHCSASPHASTLSC